MRAQVTSIGLGGVCNLAVLAPIKTGFAEGFETVTYLERLRKLLKAMHSSRQNQRESELRLPVFPDAIGRFGIIHSFRYAIVPPRLAAPNVAVRGALDEPVTSLLSLNVSFDGGWEPYMRVIYRDIGTLLDALFCHCVGYPGSSASFDEYCRWVRDNEIDGGIFYTDGPLSPGDQRYLAGVEQLQRDTTEPDEADALIARFALESDRRQIGRAFGTVWADPMAALALSLRSLKGLYRLSTYFPPDTDDGGVLVRFAQSVLAEFRQVITTPELQGSALGQLARKLLPDELAWLNLNRPKVRHTHRVLPFDKAALQSAMLARDDPVSHGALVMLRVRNADEAVAELAQLALRCGEPADATQVRHHLAFTYAGLLALEIPPERLDPLPQEFIEGMEARCGQLGDQRGNHPDRWLRPLRYGSAAPGDRIDMTAVHVVLVLRLIDPANPTVGVHPEVQKVVDALGRPGTGLTVMAVQPTRSYRGADGKIREHFGFVDGLSQPEMVQGRPPAPRSDEVSPGELLLGHPNDRGDGPFPKQPDALLDNGSFLVVRKLRQRVDHLQAALGAHPQKADVLARMMGRRQDGSAFVPLGPSGRPNDYHYDGDPGGAACPFHSHTRRTNPRDGRASLPRILRRGMSYGPRDDTKLDEERGIVFMAYCASIAEQFEILQRWIAAGSASGVASAQPDPFLGVPKVGEKRSFRYVDAAGQVARVDLGDKPFVQLEWGLYLFVPSLAALQALASFRAPPPRAVASTAMGRRPTTLEGWRRVIEDPERSVATWAQVRAQPGATLEASGYGTLVGGRDAVFGVLKDGGQKYSVAGYGERMARSIGLNHLGMDPAGGHSKLAPLINPHIAGIGMAQAFDAAIPIVTGAIARYSRIPQPDPVGPVRVAIDLVTLCDEVLAALCTLWIGLPEKQSALMTTGGRLPGATGTPRCPGHLLTASRFTFAPHPRQQVVDDGPVQGRAVLDAVRELLKLGDAALGSLARDVKNDLVTKGGFAADSDEVLTGISGLLLGFPPTVYGNFLRTMETWIDDKQLWQHQQALAEQTAAPAFDRAKAALLGPLFATMRKRPVPETLWRCPVHDGQVDPLDKQPVVLGIASALTENDAPDKLMFGGSYEADEHKTLHACPGYEMGSGVLLALIAGLLGAGTLRPTGSPVLLMLTPKAA